MDVLLLHTPRIRSGGFKQIFVLPSGIFSLADAVSSDGFDCRILHDGLRVLDPTRGTADDYLVERQPKVVGLSLHWHYQLPDVLSRARRIRELLPEAVVVVGGYTASCFHEELLRREPAIDFVVRGDGERPLVALCRHLLRGDGPLEAVPNLAWRGADGALRGTALSYVNDTANTRELSHARVDLLEDADLYLDHNLFFDQFFELERCFHYTPGKGCARSCTYCGGGRTAQRSLFGRRSYFFFARDKILRDLEALVAAGVRTVRLSFDPDPAREAHLAVFEAIRARGWTMRCVFECWSLPTETFLEGFRQTFSPDSVLILSPDCGSEALRRRHRGFFFTNAALLEAVERIRARRIPVCVYFSFGLPGERPEDADETADLMRAVKARGGRCNVNPMFLDPASPLHRHPERYDVTLACRSAADFARAHEGDAMRPGYATRELSEAEIRQTCARLESLC